MLGGIDIGGTKLAACIGTREGVVIARDRFETAPDEQPAQAVDRCLAAIQRLATEKGAAVEAIGVACPGPYDRLDRRFLDTPNMPAWQGFELGKHLDRSCRLPTLTMNDANAAVLAEVNWGAGVGAHTAVLFTMSTGFGAGIAIEGNVIEGHRGFAGEAGRVRLSDIGPAGFGTHGAAEGWLSGPGLVQLAQSALIAGEQRGEHTTLRSGPNLTPRDICHAAAAGDPIAKHITDTVAKRLGQMTAIFANLLEPQVVILGTIGSAYPDLFIPIAAETADADTVIQTANSMRIVPSGLSDRAEQAALAVACRVKLQSDSGA